MKLAILADIHSNLPALEAAFHQINDIGCDKAISIGDSIAIGPFPRETLQFLIDRKVSLIMGNHEEYYVKGLPRPLPSHWSPSGIDNIQWTHNHIGTALGSELYGLPYEEVLILKEVSIRLLHFAYDNLGISRDRLSGEFTADILTNLFGFNSMMQCFGHTHTELDISYNCRYINPGSIGCSKDDQARFLTIDDEHASLTVKRHLVQYNKQNTIDELDSRKVPDRLFIKQYFYGI